MHLSKYMTKIGPDQSVSAMWTLRKVDEKFLLSPKIIYFAVGSLFYAFGVFRIQFAKDYFGFEIDKAGDIAAVLSLTGFLTMTMWSTIADRLGRHRLVLALLALGTAGSFQLLLIKMPSETATYYYSLAVFALFGGLISGLLPLTDYQTLKLLSDKFQADKNLYGRQRMMGTVSYGLTSYIIGFLSDQFGITVLFYLFPVFALFFITSLYSFGYPDRPHKRNADVEVNDDSDNANKVDSPQSLKKPEPEAEVKKASFWVFFKSFHYLFFLSVVFVTGCGRQILQVYLSPFLKNTIKMSNGQAGIATISSTIFSVIFLFIGSHIIKFFGVYPMLVIGMFTMAFRLGCYVFVPHDPSSAWIIYAIELLNGVAFSFTHLAGVKITADFAPKGLEATGQAVYTSFYMQLPAVIVSFACGRIFKAYGGVFLFKYASIITFAYCLLTCFKYVADGRIAVLRRTPGTNNGN